MPRKNTHGVRYHDSGNSTKPARCGCCERRTILVRGLPALPCHCQEYDPHCYQCSRCPEHCLCFKPRIVQQATAHLNGKKGSHGLD